MKKWGLVATMLLTLSLPWSITSVEAKMDNLPRLPGAILLTGYPPDNLMVTTGDATSKLQAGGGDWYVTPSMSADGHLIASARTATNAPPAPRPRPTLTVAVYSVISKEWKDYANVQIVGGTVAISPDGSKLACVTRSTAETPSRLQFVDLKTGAVSPGPESTKNAGQITWSPDGRRIAFDKEDARSVEGKVIPSLRAIYILDVESGTVSKIAEGMSPSWSPSGEWIAFYDYQPGRDDAKKGWYATNANRVSIVHPDGKDYKTLVIFHSDESLKVPPVWSPDSESILLNRFRDEDKATMDIYLLDLDTIKLARKFENMPPVFAWAAAK
jgi:hypothetical protein